MPIRIREDLPAYQALLRENIFIMSSLRAEKQDIRPLKIILLNLMPKKIETEEQVLRLLGNTPLQVDIEFLRMKSHTSKNTSAHHLIEFYTDFASVRDHKYDGMLITGAPVEKLEFKDVDYWNELCEIMEWSKSHVFSCVHICWGAQAGLFYHFGINKRELSQKLSGVFKHKTTLNSPLLRGFDDEYMVPHSRYTECVPEEIRSHPSLNVLSVSDGAGIHIVSSADNRQFFVFGHAEYGAMTLSDEYFRDLRKGINPTIPCNYFPDDNPSNSPNFRWCGHANLMFSNWLNYCVYQHTPYDLNQIS
jgi:homoserine O-succinyltransferase